MCIHLLQINTNIVIQCKTIAYPNWILFPFTVLYISYTFNASLIVLYVTCVVILVHLLTFWISVFHDRHCFSCRFFRGSKQENRLFVSWLVLYNTAGVIAVFLRKKCELSSHTGGFLGHLVVVITSPYHSNVCTSFWC